MARHECFCSVAPTDQSSRLPHRDDARDCLHPGFMVRSMAVIGMLFVTHLWLGLYHHPAEWPWLYVFLIFVQGFFVLDAAGKSLGLDALIARAPFGPFRGSSLIARIYRSLA